MKKHLHKLLLFLLCLPLLQLQAKDVYGFMTGNGNVDQIPVGMYRFDSETHERESLSNIMVGFWGGAFGADTYYFIYSSDYQGFIYNGLGTFDFHTHQIGSVDASQPYQCSDMTYDVTTKTMYGIQIKNAGEDVPHTLITINPTTGMKTSIGKVATPIAALACNNWGELFAMGYDGNLYQVDKQSVELKLIGSTGIQTDQVQAQSMEFDRDTGILYWTCLTNHQDALIVKLNIYSDSPVIEQKVMMDNALIVGLHIPVAPIAPQAPAALNKLEVSSTGDKAVLKWVNPTQTYTGQALTELTKIEIVRNNEVIHTISQPTVGAEISWEDLDASHTKGNIRYVLYAYNEVGKSEGVTKKLIVGDDIPGIVTNFELTAEGNQAHLSWTAPTEGKNGGNLTAAHLRYTLTRMPDKKVFDNIEGTTWTDHTIETPAYYYYIIECYNTAGKGNELSSETQAIGLPIKVPFTTNFGNELLAAQWKIVNANNDNATWEWKNGKYVYPFSFSTEGDDHLISVPFYLESGVDYVVKYTIDAPNMFSNPEHFAIKVGDQVIEDLNKYNNKTPEERTVAFTVTQTGNYPFILSALSPKDNWQIAISSFAVEKMVTTDLALSGLKANTEDLKEGIPATLTAQVTNKGIESVLAYEVVLTDQNQNVLVSQSFKKKLNKGDEKIVTFDWNPQKEVKEITATVKVDDDMMPQNNQDQLKVYVLGQNESYVSYGEKTSKPYFFPFAFDGKKYAYSQAIYRKNELNMASATLNGISYDYDNYGAELTGKHIKVYLCNTDESSLKMSGWFEETDMTLVFDGIVDFVQGKHSLRLVFDQPFVYTGQHLAIYNQKLDDEAVGNINFYAQNYGGNEARTTIYMDNNPVVSMNLVQGSTMLNHITFRMQDIKTAIDHVATDNEDYGLTLNGDQLTLNQPVESITIYDMTGKLISKQHHTQQMSLKRCEQGIYLVNIVNGNDQLVKKIIKR